MDAAMLIRQRLSYFSLLALLAGLPGCGVTTVQDIHAHPHRNWFTSTVYLRGTVSDRAPLIGGQVYQLQDSSGKIWVLTNQTGLKVGDRILIKGHVHYQSIPEGERDLGEAYIEQSQLLERNGEKTHDQ